MKDDVKKKYSQETDETVYDDALAELERSQNYKAYYDQAIQTYNMKQNTQKYMNNMLQNQGLAGTGYGSSMQAGINNQAMNAYAQNMADYAQAEARTTANAYERYNERTEEEDNQLALFLSSADSKEGKDKYLQNFGYMDANGNYTDKWNSLDENRKAYIQSVYDTYGQDQGTSTGVSYNANNLSSIQFKDDKGEIKNFDEQTIGQVQYALSTGQIEEGGVIALGHYNGKGRDSSYVYLKYENGQFVRITEE